MVKRVLPGLIAASAIALGLALYLHIASVQSAVNSNLNKSNQSAYMDFAQQAWESGYTYTGGRNRMPLYPWIQGLFYSPDLSDEAYFDQGKAFNVILSITCLAVIGAAFIARFSKLYAIYSVVVIGYLVFNIKAPYFQPEILYYTLFALAFILSIDTIRSPKWHKSAGVGLLFALAYFTKASAILGLIIYACSFIVAIASHLRRGKSGLRQAGRALAHAFVPVLVFAILLFPYFNESKDRYGHYLYNVNTTFYMWYDSWAEAKAGTRAAGDREGWPNLPDDEIPSLANYLSEHTPADILDRLGDGLTGYVDKTCTRTKSSQLLGNCIHLGLGAAIAIFCLAAGLPYRRERHDYRTVQTSLFIVGFLTIYALSAAWYWPIIVGGRVMLALAIPLLWTVGLLTEQVWNQQKMAIVMDRAISLPQLTYAVLLVLALYQVYELVAFRAAKLWGGF